MKLSLESKCLHLEKDTEGPCKENLNHYGAISFPIYQTASFAHPGPGESTGFDYGRLQNPTRQQLEKIVAQLEKGIDSIALSTGMAAITLLFEMFSPGDHIIIDSDLYGGSIRLFEQVSAKNGLKFTRAEFYKDDIEALITPETKALYIESPTNPMMNVTDIKKIAQISKRHNLIFIVDNTFLSPYFQNPLELGADLVVHSGTKYLGGHNDTLAGFVITNRKDLSEKLRFLLMTTGAVLAPFDSWLLLRGIKTLGIRMEKAAKNALKIADWLENQKNVEKVFYPGLKTHPGYNILKEQARGFGAMITFEVSDKEKAVSVLKKVKLVQFAESLGGVETLITYPETQTHASVPEELRRKNGIKETTLRLSVGIENVDDIIADLQQALED